VRDFCVTFYPKDGVERWFAHPFRRFEQPRNVRRRVVRRYTRGSVPKQVLTFLERYARCPQPVAEGVLQIVNPDVSQSGLAVVNLTCDVIQHDDPFLSVLRQPFRNDAKGWKRGT
jgi:hypothetical protein